MAEPGRGLLIAFVAELACLAAALVLFVYGVSEGLQNPRGMASVVGIYLSLALAVLGLLGAVYTTVRALGRRPPGALEVTVLATNALILALLCGLAILVIF